MKTWINDSNLKVLTENEWFWEGQGLGSSMWLNCDGMSFPTRGTSMSLIWIPPPCIAEVALESLRKSLHRRPDMLHVFVCPRVMTCTWMKQMLKSCTMSFFVDVGTSFWPSSMHEPLVIGIYLPNLVCPPFTLRRSRSVLVMEGKLRALSKSKAGTQGTILRQFLLFTRSLPALSESMVWSLLSKGRIR